MFRTIAEWERCVRSWSQDGWRKNAQENLWADLSEAWLLGEPQRARMFSRFLCATYPSRTGIRAKVELALSHAWTGAELTHVERELIRHYVEIWYFDCEYQGAQKTKARWMGEAYPDRFLEWVRSGHELRWPEKNEALYCTCNISGRRMCPKHGDNGENNTTNPVKDTDMFSTLTVNLINGTVGQVISQGTGQIVWQSEPFEDLVKEDGTTVKAADQAKEAANEAIKSAEMEMFAPKKKARS